MARLAPSAPSANRASSRRFWKCAHNERIDETDVLAGFVLARASAGLADGAVRGAAAVRGVDLRPLRAGAFAAVCVMTTALGHALMSGDPLPW
ncbi:hypothetical protein ACIRQQ_48410 [Streptomyces fuscichromogenes]|uniref:hypothetical protein n=1 Tax=Streptomyces fuscichromogenes TaxID=1324013 RepID=UPI0037FA88D8